MAEISIEVIDKRIVVKKPGTDFSVTYEKRTDADTIMMTKTWVPSNMTSPTISEFRVQAFLAALAKAREIGWIV